MACTWFNNLAIRHICLLDMTESIVTCNPSGKTLLDTYILREVEEQQENKKLTRLKKALSDLLTTLDVDDRLTFLGKQHSGGSPRSNPVCNPRT